MVKVVIPALLESLCSGQRKLEVAAATLGETLRKLDEHCPGIYDRIVEDGRVRPQLAIAVNGEVYQMPLHERLKPDTELTIVPAIGGGCSLYCWSWHSVQLLGFQSCRAAIG